MKSFQNSINNSGYRNESGYLARRAILLFIPCTCNPKQSVYTERSWQTQIRVVRAVPFEILRGGTDWKQKIQIFIFCFQSTPLRISNGIALSHCPISMWKFDLWPMTLISQNVWNMMVLIVYAKFGIQWFIVRSINRQTHTDGLQIDGVEIITLDAWQYVTRTMHLPSQAKEMHFFLIIFMNPLSAGLNFTIGHFFILIVICV